MSKNKISLSNIVEGHRVRRKQVTIAKEDGGVKANQGRSKKKARNVKPYLIEVGDWISVDSKIFDGNDPGSFSKSNPERQIGEVDRVGIEKHCESQVE